VSTEDSGPEEDLYDGFELHLPWTQSFLDPVPMGGGDAQVFQKSLKPTSGDWSFSPKALHLVRISVHLLILCAAWGRLVFISLVFYAMVPWLLLLLSRRTLSQGTLRDHQLSHPVFRPKQNAFLYVCENQVSYIK
jgi:hypothetical protein